MLLSTFFVFWLNKYNYYLLKIYVMFTGTIKTPMVQINFHKNLKF